VNDLTGNGLSVHAPSGLLVCLDSGRVFNKDGVEVGAKAADSYVRVIRRAEKSNQVRTWYAHRVVWEVANGPIPEGMQIDHLDCDAGNNALRNLDLVTPSENRARQARRNLQRYGCRSTHCKLNPEQVEAIRDSADVIPSSVWAKRLGITPRTVREVRAGDTWKHLLAADSKKGP
jgi:hypothetical protein